MGNIRSRRTVPISEGEATVPAFISLSDAARRLGKEKHYTRGYVDALRVQLTPVGKARVMAWADFLRVEHHMRTRESINA